MPIIEIRTEVRASIETVFDLCRSVEVHVATAGQTKERAVGGVTAGLLELGDEVTSRAGRFGVRQTLTSRITRFERSGMFRDSMMRGVSRRFDHDHDHVLAQKGETTLIGERLDFDSPLGPLGWLAHRLFVTRHMTAFLTTRLARIKSIAESGLASR